MMLRWVSNIDIPLTTVLGMSRKASRAIGSSQFGCFFLGDAEKLQDRMIAAHHRRGMAALKAGPGAYPVGVNIALQDEQPVGPASARDKKCEQVYHPWLAAASRSDFLGIQAYTRSASARKATSDPSPAWN